MGLGEGCVSGIQPAGSLSSFVIETTARGLLGIRVG